MRRSTAGLAVLTLLLSGPFWSPAPAWGEEEPEPTGVAEADARLLRKELGARAKEWWRHRKRVAESCRECKGTGKVRLRGGRSGPFVACAKCDARKTSVDEKEYRHCFYVMRSPAYRLQEGVQDRVQQEYESARRGRPFPDVVKKYTVKEIELLDASHGVVHVEQNRESVARPQRWIQAQDRGEDPTWYLYDARVDGRWPGEAAPEAEPEPPTPEPATREPVKPRPLPVRPPPSRPTPGRADPPRGPTDRADFADSLELLEKWTNERNDAKARVIRIRLGLDGVEGHAETVADARTFVAEVQGWLDEAKPAYDRAKKDVEEQTIGVLLADRLKINTLHFKAHRRLELVERMLVAVVPGLRD